mmetsp:Transcript_6968/g.20369  ORF Transcript_6968/g.20369 Transcript_6968/m.20369 type:complete len:134 (-) Transcript_6968:174-575(-)
MRSGAALAVQPDGAAQEYARTAACQGHVRASERRGHPLRATPGALFSKKKTLPFPAAMRVTKPLLLQIPMSNGDNLFIDFLMCAEEGDEFDNDDSTQQATRQGNESDVEEEVQFKAAAPQNFDDDSEDDGFVM